MRKIIIVLAFLCFLPSIAHATTWHVRTDGGTNTQCTGTTDAAYPGSGTGQLCAVNHPAWLIPPRNENTSTKAAANDTIVVHSGSYRMGCQNSSNCRDSNYNYTQAAYCDPSYSYECLLSDGSTSVASLPNGLSIVGCSSGGCASEADYPELWGAGRITQMFKLDGSNGVLLKHLIITDHASCIYSHSTLACGTADSSELSIKWGIHWSGATNAHLLGVKIRGPYAEGIKGVCVDCTIDGPSEINFGYTGFDTTDETWASGQTITFGSDENNSPSVRWQIAWSGCADDGTGLAPAANGCISNGGSDGYGGTATNGNVVAKWGWVHHNGADGLDFLYFDDGLVNINISNMLFQQNGGNQLKASGNVFVYNSIFESECGYFNSGADFVNDGQFEYCRSAADTLAFTFQANTDVVLDGNTINFNDGNNAITINARKHSSTNCTSANSLTIRNMVAKANGKAAALGGGANGWINVDSNCTSAVVTTTYSNVYNYASNPSGTGNVFTDPLLSGAVTHGVYAAYLSASSPGRDIATEATSQPSTDYNGFDRGGAYDAGALEFGSVESGGGGGFSTQVNRAFSGRVTISGGVR